MRNIKNLKVSLLTVFILLFVFLNFNCGIIDVDSKNINVSGVVTDQNGNPVDSVLISLYTRKGFFSNSNIKATTLTNSLGHYSISKFFDDNKKVYLSANKTIFIKGAGLKNYYWGPETYPVILWTDQPQIINMKLAER